MSMSIKSEKTQILNRTQRALCENEMFARNIRIPISSVNKRNLNETAQEKSFLLFTSES